MSNDIQDIINMSPADTSSVQPQAEAFNSFLAMPVTKLDADQYLVSDLDGITEGLFGSGNMNFLMMQAGQTDESIINRNPFDYLNNPDTLDGTASTLPYTSSAPLSSGMDLASGGMRMVDDLQNEAAQLSGGYDNTGSSSVSGNDSASALSDMLQTGSAFNSVQNNASATSTNTTNNHPPGTDGVSGTNGTNGTNGQDGTGGGGDVINNITNNYTDFLTETVENVTNVVNNVTNNTTDIVNNLVNNIFNTINEGGSLGPVGIDLGLDLDNITNITLDIISGDQILNIINEVIDLSPILTPLDDLLGNVAAGVDLSVILNPFQYDNSPDDKDLSILTDLSALGLPLLSSLDNIHVPLDLVEGLLGDLDIELDLRSDVLGDLLGGLLGGNGNDTDLALGLGSALGGIPLLNGAENILFNPVEELLGDIDIKLLPNLDLFNTSAIDNAAGDKDIVIPLDTNLLGGNLFENALTIELDPVEAIVGDIDLDLTLAANLLGNVADNLLDGIAGGTGNDTVLSHLGDGVSNLLSPLLPASNGEDTDVALNLGGTLPGVDLINNTGSIFLNPVEDLIGDIDLGITPSLNLFDASGTDNAAGDTDITIPLQIDLIDNTLLDKIIDIQLDPLEQITGDIDLDITAAVNVLGDKAAGLIDTFDGGSGTPNLLSDVGSALSNLTESILSHSIDNFDHTNPLSMVESSLDIFEIVPDAEAVSANLVQSVTQNIETTIENALNILSPVSTCSDLLNTGILNGLGDIGNAGSWTESTLPEAGNLFGAGLVGDIINILPDPVSAASPVESIMPMPIVNDVFDGLGLGGGRHFGGLFG